MAMDKATRRDAKCIGYGSVFEHIVLQIQVQGDIDLAENYIIRACY